MKKTVLSLSLLSCALLAEDIALPNLSITAAQEPTAFETKDIDYTPEFSNTLPSNMSSISSFSGIKIDGATSDFTSVYWNGIEVTDPSNTNNYPTLMNYGRSGSDTLSVDGSNINYKTQANNSISLQGGSPKYGRVSLAKTFRSKKALQTLRVDGIYAKTKTAYTNRAGSYNNDEEKDSLKTLDISYLGRFQIGETLSTKLSLLHKSVAYDYDAGYPTNPDDTNSSANSKLSIVGFDFGYDSQGNELKFDMQQVNNKRSFDSAYTSDYTSNVLRVGAKATLTAKDLGVKFKTAFHEVTEKAKVSGTDYNRTYEEYEATLLYKADFVELNLNYKKSYSSTESKSAIAKVPLSNTFAFLAKYEDKEVNPTIVQENPIYTIANSDLKSQKLKKYSTGLEFSSAELGLFVRASYAKVLSDDMITYVTIDPKTYTSQYQNVDKTRYDFSYLEVDYNFLEDFDFNANYAYVANFVSSKPSLVYNLPEHKAVGKLSFDNNILNSYLLVSYTSNQKAYGGDVKASTTANFGIGYMLNDDLEIRSDIYNITDKYYEYNKNYPENPRLITATLKYNF